MSDSRADLPDDVPPSQMEDGDLHAKIQSDLRAHDRASSKWRTGARWAFKLVDGDQWTTEERAILEEDARQPITFNRIAPMVDAVCGSQVNNRQETKFLPRTMDDGGKAELWQGVVVWARDQSDAEDEESEAFRDMAVCGMGWTETRIDYTEDPEGRIIIERVDPLEMRWDSASNKKNLFDARWKARIKEMPIEDVKALWPDYDALPAGGTARGGQSQATRRWDQYRETEDEQDADNDPGDTIEVVEYQWRETETAYQVVDPSNGQQVQLTAEQWATLGERLGKEQRDGLQHTKQPRNKWFRVFCCGDQLMDKAEAPDPECSTFQCMTARRDRGNKSWYGIVRAAEDPQRWANKWLTQSLHILNTSAKSGVIAEETAIIDMAKFEASWAKPGGVSLVGDGTLSGGRLQPKVAAAMPPGFDRMLQFAIAAIPDVTGINKELLGTANREQAGVLEWQRKQAGQAVLAPLFDALRLYYKQHGRLMLRFVSKYIPPHRQIRVTDAKDVEQLVTIANLPDARSYDVVVDQSPTSPNQKMEVWQFLQPMLPALMKAGVVPPPVLLKLMEFSPLPESVVKEIQEMSAQMQQQQGPPPEVQKMQAELQMKQQAAQQDAQMEKDKTAAQLAAKEREAKVELFLEAQKADQEMRLEEKRAAHEMRLAEQKANHEMRLMREKSTLDAQVKTDEANTRMQISQQDASTRQKIKGAPAKQQDAVMEALTQTVAALKEMREDADAPIERINGPDGRLAAVKRGRRTIEIMRPQ